MAVQIMQADLAKLPVFQGDKKDPFSAEQWADRVAGAKRAAGWDDPTTLLYMKNALRGPALIWYENLPRSLGRAQAILWEPVRVHFLRTYSKVRTARTATTNLAEVRQANNESVNDYYNRVLSAINDLQQLMPVATLVREALPDAYHADIRGLAGWDAVDANHKRATLNRAMLLASDQTYNYIALQHFIANLKSVYRDELMKSAPATLLAAFMEATEIENIQTTPNRFTTGSVTEVEPEDEEHGERDEELETEIEAVNERLRQLQNRRPQRGGAQRGRGSYRGRGAQRGNRGGAARGGSNTAIGQCWYCKKSGHRQDDCYARKNAGAPKVNRSGQPQVNSADTTPATPGGAPAPALQQQPPQIVYAMPPGFQPFQQPGMYQQGHQGSIYDPNLSQINSTPSISGQNLPQPVFY
jgi:hypothetical protein